MRKLEQKYERELVIVGVHAGKYLAERVTENIRQAVLRLDIKHPVVNDRQFRIWRAYGVHAWPTLVLINPVGHYVDSHAGEITFESFDPVVGQLARAFEARGKIDRTPVNFHPEELVRSDQQLAFPAKVLATGERRLFIADTDRNRVLAVNLEEDGRAGTVDAVIGSGEEGMRDGDFQTAKFHHPHGLALHGETLYIADTENHTIRAADLRRRQVMTIAGTGEQAHRFGMTGPGLQVPLNSPWDLLVHLDTLYIAMAGSHQIYTIDLTIGQIGPFAGSGLEDLLDGPARVAALAQPSGLASDGRTLYFADSESSAIRHVSLYPGNEVATIVGTGLFDFGDKDGVGDAVRLQHPQGVAQYDGRLYVADTYNNKIKVVEPWIRRSATFLGTGEAGLRDGEQPLFYEPGGLSAANGLLYIADTNNHAVRVADLGTSQVTTLQLNW